jgi:MFS family permease
MAIPGALLSVLLMLTINESQTRSVSTSNLEKIPAAHRHVFRSLWKIRAFRHAPLAQSALAIALFGQIQWLPAFVERSFGIGRVAMGQALGLTLGMSTVAGILAGGAIADRLARSNALWRLRLIVAALLLSIVPTIALYNSRSVHWAYAWAAMGGFLLAAPTGPFFSVVQTIIPPTARATAVATTFMVTAFLGLGGGPLVIGLLSDYWNPRLGPESLRYALLFTVLGAIFWAIFHITRMYFLASAVEAAHAEAHASR